MIHNPLWGILNVKFDLSPQPKLTPRARLESSPKTLALDRSITVARDFYCYKENNELIHLENLAHQSLNLTSLSISSYDL